VLGLQSIASLPPLLAAFASNSKLAYLGGLRAAISVLSYELVSGLLILLPCLTCHSLNFADLISFQKLNGNFLLFMPTLGALFILVSLVETNRAPFDLAESESELVAGFHVEYSGFLFALFFLAEYSFMAFSANIFCIIFLGATVGTKEILNINYGVIVSFIYFIIILVRAVLPRIRFDQLIFLC
jgi:NADH-quinone oxidoreductase subunit H